MPLVIAAAGFIGRQVVQIAVTLGLIELADKTLFPLVESAVAKVATAFGTDEETAKDIVANEWIDYVEAVGIGALTLKSRLPLRVADYLKFSTRGVAKRPLPATVAPKVSAAKATTVAASAASAEVMTQTIQSIAMIRKVPLSMVSEVVSFIQSKIGTALFATLVVAQFIDFAAWNSSAYQGTFQKFWSIFGLEPDKTYGGPRVASQEVFDKVYTALQNEGARTITHPDTGEKLPFNQQNALLVVDKVASKLFIETGEVKSKALLGLTLALVTFGTATTAAGATYTTAQGGGSTSAVVAVTPQIKIFTGVISGGTLGLPQEFVARPDDLIQSEDELRAAIKNNLAAAVASLPGRFFYEIGIVNSVKTKSGFTQKGAPIKIVSGYTTTGKPRYKTIYHKFAVMKLGVTDENGRVVKLGTVNLGPLNPADYNATPEALRSIEKTISAETFTTNINEIAQVVSSQPVQVSSVPTSAPPSASQSVVLPTQTRPQDRFGKPLPVEGEVFRVVGDKIRSSLYKVIAGQIVSIGQPQGVANARLEDNGKIYEPGSITPAWGPNNSVRILTQGFNGVWWSVIQAGDVYDKQNGAGAYDRLNEYNMADLQEHVRLNGSLTAKTNKTKYTSGQTATSLAEFFAANGLALPSLAERAQLYESAGLGPASTYVGTAEQNNKLLGWLKSLLVS